MILWPPMSFSMLELTTNPSSVFVVKGPKKVFSVVVSMAAAFATSVSDEVETAEPASSSYSEGSKATSVVVLSISFSSILGT